MSTDIRDVIAPNHWELWRQRRWIIVNCVLAVLSAAAATAVLAVNMDSVRTRDLGMLAGLIILGVTQAELGRQVERVRRRIVGGVHINMTSVWLLPGVLLLPPVLTAGLVVVLYTHLKVRSWYRLKQVSSFRTVFTISATVLTCYLTRASIDATGIHGVRAAVQAGWAGAEMLALAVVSFFVINAVMVIPGLTTTERTLQNLVGTWSDNLLEFTTLCLGALLAVILLAVPPLAALIIPPVFLLHRAVLVEQLESVARQDVKTGVWNMAGWHRMANRELARDDVACAVLMIDLDHFKRINDTHGHLAGDAVLRAVADAITGVVRRRDLVGRFGGEEFVVLLPDLTPAHVRDVADRIRVAIAGLELTEPRIDGLSASIGIATYPASGSTVERLLRAADIAMYRAKRAGRNRVVQHGERENQPSE